MKKSFLKYFLYAGGGLVILLLVATAAMVALFDPENFKSLLVHLVKEKTQRTLYIEGTPRLDFWPGLGVELERVALSGIDHGAAFATIRKAKVYVAVLPLLRKKLVVDTIVLEGLTADLLRRRDGSTNFDDLLAGNTDWGRPDFAVQGIRLDHATIALKDEMTGCHFRASRLGIHTGRVAPAQPVDMDTGFHIEGNSLAMPAAPKPSPALKSCFLNADVQLRGALRLDPDRQQYGIRGLHMALRGEVAEAGFVDVQLSADVSGNPQEWTMEHFRLAATGGPQQGWKLVLEAPAPVFSNGTLNSMETRFHLNHTEGEHTLLAQFTAADLNVTTSRVQSSGVTGDLTLRQGARSISAVLASPLSADLERRTLDLPALAGTLLVRDPALPRGELQGSFNAGIRGNARRGEVQATLNAEVAGSLVRGKVAVDGFSPLHVRFDLVAGQWDLNRMLGSETPAGGARFSWAGWKPLRLEGRMRAGAIHYGRYRIGQLETTLRADGQTLMADPLSFRLDDSRVAGRAGVRHFDAPLYVLDLRIDRLDANRYLPSQPASTPSGSAAASALAALKAFNASGRVQIGRLRYGETESLDVRIEFEPGVRQPG